MATITPPIIPAELVQAATLKIEELNRTKETFKKRYQNSAAANDANSDTLQRATDLLNQIKTLDPYLEKQEDLLIISRYLEQAKDDRSVSHAKLEKFEKQLLNKVAIHRNCLEVSSLHTELLKETINANASTASVAAKLEKAALEDEFEIVEQELDEEHDKFEKNAFASPQGNVEEFEKWLATMYEGESCEEALSVLREHIEEYGDSVISGAREMEDEDVEWCIKDLLERRSLNDDQTKKLQGFLLSPAAIREIRSTINMKSVRHWNWSNAEQGLPVTARLNSEGKYRIFIDEDIIDMLFLHTLAIGWSAKLKEYLKDVITAWNVRTRNNMPSLEHLHKREYYLMGPRMAVQRKPPQKTICTVCHPTPMPQPPPMVGLPPPPPPGVYALPPRKTKSKKNTRIPITPYGGSNIYDEQYRSYTRDFLFARLPNREGCMPEVTPRTETQAQLLKQLAAEAKFRHAIDGELHGLALNFESFAASLPHQIILAALKFIGVSQQWLEVFTRFLQAPLNLGPLVRGTSDRVLNRTAGVPENHGMELFMGELVLSFFDFAVQQKTGGHLYRIGHQGYFIGKQDQVNDARSSILELSKIMGLDALCTPLSAEPIGFLKMRVDEKSVDFTIQNGLVDEYAHRVKKQLGASTTVLNWIRVWNTTMGTYAAHLFGPLANVFGKDHLDAVTQAYNRMNEIIFGESSLTEHCKFLLVTHLGPKLSILSLSLEALIYLPTAYGGLGVKNPYITLNLARDLEKDPNAEIQAYFDSEKVYYEDAKTAFGNKRQDVRERHIATLCNDDKEKIASTFGPDGQNTFWTFEEMTKHREQLCYPIIPLPYPRVCGIPNILTVFNRMLDEPTDQIEWTDQVSDKIRELSGRNRMKRWINLSGEDRWVLQMYSEECFERYGSLEIWHGESVPMELLSLVRGEDDDDSDDTSTISDYSTV
jgi:hypothetical protein